MKLGRHILGYTAGFARRFLRGERGNVAIIFAMTGSVVLAAAGAGIEYSRVVVARTQMSAALDAAALAVAKESEITESQAETLAQKYFDTNLAGEDDISTSPVHVTIDGNVISLTVTATMQTKILDIVGVNTIRLVIANEVQRETTPRKMRVVLALDNTGSMASSGKMTALKTATHNLINTLRDTPQQDGEILVSIIPFAREVKVGTDEVGESWIDWTDWNSRNGDWEEIKTCTGSGKNRKCTTDDVWVPDSHLTWTGCVMDRDQSYDVKNTTPVSGNRPTMFPAKQSSDCPTRILGLTNNWTTLHSKIDAMTPTGNTNTTIGLAWAWQALTGGDPMKALSLPAGTEQYIIFMTDGQNTQNRWTTSSSSIDARMSAACTNVKNAGIKLYTILVIDGNPDLLRNCATEPGMFYQITSADQLVTVFGNIGDQLSRLHLTQ